MVDFLRGHPKAVALLQTCSNRIILSSIVVAEAENAELKTLNTRHYPMLKGLNPPYP
jgi:hypothetical protein